MEQHADLFGLCRCSRQLKEQEVPRQKPRQIPKISISHYFTLSKQYSLLRSEIFCLWNLPGKFDRHFGPFYQHVPRQKYEIPDTVGDKVSESHVDMVSDESHKRQNQLLARLDQKRTKCHTVFRNELAKIEPEARERMTYAEVTKEKTSKQVNETKAVRFIL